MPLTARQELFCQEYLKDLNATQAAIRAGYSKDTARSIGSENLTKPDISDRIAELQADRAAALKIDAEYVLRQAVEIHRRCMQEIRPVLDRKGEQVYDEDGMPVYAFDARGAVSSLTLVGKHVGVQAFQENVNHTGLDALAERLARAKKRTGDDA